MSTDSVCDSQWGVGLSSGLRGKFDNLDVEAFHDAFMVAHEIGHSLGSGMWIDASMAIVCPLQSGWFHVIAI